MSRLLGEWPTGGGNVIAVRYLCGFCGLNVSSERGWNVNHDADKNNVRVCPSCNRPTFFEAGGKQIPGVPYGRAVPNLPTEIEKLYDEAVNRARQVRTRLPY